jgi:hypothetical protein
MVLMTVMMLAEISGLFQSDAFQVQYPPNAVGGGTVVIAVTGAGGATQARVLSGEEPFISAVRGSMNQWRFPDSAEKRLVIVKFRRPELMSVGASKEEVPAPAGGAGAFPYPTAVTEPSFPPNSLGDGSVVLKLDLSSSGSIEKVETVQGLGQLTDSGIEAVRQWSFQPARNSRGLAVPSEAYVVLVYRAPVLSPSRPR